MKHSWAKATANHENNSTLTVIAGTPFHLGGEIEAHVSIGTCAVVLEKLRIVERAKIGSGAVVIKDVPPNVTATGVPTKILKGIHNGAPSYI